MKVAGNIRKMRSELGVVVQYQLPLYNILEPKEIVDMNALIGKEISIRFDGEIHCIVTGKKIKKAYGEGMSYEAFRDSPLAVESIIRPELSRIHEGVALRDKEWEEKYHLQPHVTYLSRTSGIKVGVTRDTQIPTRWIDQGATEAIVLAETPYRQAAGLIEVALKEFVADKTNWRAMLKNEVKNETPLIEKKAELVNQLSNELKQFVVLNNEVQKINYPVEQYPIKVKSLKLDKVPLIQKKLVGIKGQYLLFEDETVLNLRSHAAYRIMLEY